jgi:predicted nucleic acid-binding protein
VIFLDSNVPMYLVGSPHPNKVAAERAVAELIARQEKLVSNTEVSGDPSPLRSDRAARCDSSRF